MVQQRPMKGAACRQVLLDGCAEKGAVLRQVAALATFVPLGMTKQGQVTAALTVQASLARLARASQGKPVRASQAELDQELPFFCQHRDHSASVALHRSLVLRGC